jgi:hypothetical protein
VTIAVTTLAMVTVAFAAQQGGGKGQQKVTICHEGHTITVGASALAAHERHEDTEGACETATPERTGGTTTPDTTTPETTTPETTTPDTTTQRGGHDRPRLHPGAKITLKLLRHGESQSLAEVYASENTGFKVKRAMRRGLMVFCHPGGYDTVTFTCEGATPPPETTTPPETTAPETTAPENTVPATTP